MMGFLGSSAFLNRHQICWFAILRMIKRMLNADCLLQVSAVVVASFYFVLFISKEKIMLTQTVSLALAGL